ncbi:hypothetical protein GXB78_06970 [Pseudomonas moraviensis subsp. stanleyae]|uniref:DUF6124 family protein n=1 Tax=Pseudomonas moraviensis TaxID=321662 RepID=UPI002E378DD1|nr:hypothetical protein [Pseudomonas moraviensis]MED7666932.1 hypothetical protein [Pseudomonas moraviensis subsp. stanleyae]
MFKATPNPPTPHGPDLDSQKVKEATDRALNYYLKPADLAAPPNSPKYRPVYVVDPTLDDETLLLEACESLSYAHAMAGNIANSIGGPERKPLLALQQVIMLNELLVNRLLDKLKLPQ